MTEIEKQALSCGRQSNGLSNFPAGTSAQDCRPWPQDRGGGVMTTITDAERKLVETILNAYHTTRLKDTDPVEHVLSKGTVQQAFARHREAEVAKIVVWLLEAEWPYRNDALIAAIEAGEYRND